MPSRCSFESIYCLALLSKYPYASKNRQKNTKEEKPYVENAKKVNIHPTKTPLFSNKNTLIIDKKIKNEKSAQGVADIEQYIPNDTKKPTAAKSEASKPTISNIETCISHPIAKKENTLINLAENSDGFVR